MKPVLFEGHDIVLGAPAGWDAAKHGECQGLPIMRDKGVCASLWELDAKERMSIACGANVWLRVFSGPTQPPVSLSVGRVVVDYQAVDCFRAVIIGNGHTMGTQIVDIESGRRLRWVESFTLSADAQSGLLLARLVVHDMPDQLGDPVLDPVGLECFAVIAERVQR